MKKLLSTAAALAMLTFSIPAQAGMFNGAFLGLQLGHNNTKIEGNESNLLGAGESLAVDFGASGPEFGVVGGYRIKQDRFVFGVEAEGALSNASSTLIDIDDGAGNTGRLELEKRYSYAIGPRIGYLVTDNSLMFVGVDWAHGSFKGTGTANGAASASGNVSLNGIRFGGGMEIAATEKISLRLDYQHTDWGTYKESDGAGGTVSLKPTEDTARISGIYSF
ncbi:MAG: porin family protein [Burkholderiales bacterium]|nr:porin family protein [Burkholderiales bacterium]